MVEARYKRRESLGVCTGSHKEHKERVRLKRGNKKRRMGEVGAGGIQRRRLILLRENKRYEQSVGVRAVGTQGIG